MFISSNPNALNISFAAFVMTYNRVEILPDTIHKIKQQTFAPEYILIVDNSDNNLTEDYIKNLNDPKIGYYKVGYNSGPAGGAYYGLKILAERGFNWIYWGDDDDPPFYNDTFEILLNSIVGKENIGVVGQVGALINPITGDIVRIKDEKLIGDYLRVDYIGGGQCMIVNSKLIPECLPEKELFFGFEDLSFALRVKATNFKMLVPVELFIRNRKKSGSFGTNKMSIPGNSNYKASWRLYYSTRSLIYIYFHEQNKIIPTFIQLLKTIIKILNSKGEKRSFLLKGLIHGFTKKMGKTINTAPVIKNG